MKENPQSVHFKRQLGSVVHYNDLEALPEIIKDQLAVLRKNVKNVLVIYTGGTIGMYQNEHGQLVPAENAGELLQPLKIKGLDKEVNVVWFQIPPKVLDSTNGRWVNWVTYGNIINLLYDHFDGFVIASGTDTMAHMIAAMNLMFPNLGKPVVATGSQLPMYKLGDDAQRNLYAALSAACSDLSGAHLMFADNLMHGLHVHKIKDRNARAFDCPPQYILGSFDGEIAIFENAPRRNPIVNKQRLIYKTGFREGIKVIKISPATPSVSMVYDGHDPMCPISLVITFGAGNVRDDGSYELETTHLDGIKQLTEEGIPVVLGSPMMDGRVESPYIAGAKAVSKEIGGISAGGITGPALEVVLMQCLYFAWDEEKGKVDINTFRQIMEEKVSELDMKR